MCGITGIVSESGKVASESHVEEMLAALEHRGPDSSGRVYGMAEHVKLAMTRLAIIDVKTGQQPFYSEDKQIAIIANGEIYNYEELKKKLKQKHKFVSKSDIEIILHLYEEYGTGVFKFLKGMFAIAIYDKKKDELILARDRWGEKPLYYCFSNNKFYFSSELKSLLKINSIDKKLNLDALKSYFYYYYIPEYQTAFKNINKLDAGSYAVVNEGNKIEIKKYWNPSKKLVKRKNLKKKIEKAFIKACERTMLSDVPVGIALSGGFDSAAVVSTLAPKFSKKLSTFTIGYEGSAPTDESSHAKKLADHYGMKHFTLKLKDKDVVSDFPQVIISQDDPIADIAASGVDAVSRLAKKHGMKVLINGAGGDELFWGYSWVRSALKADLDKKNKEPVLGSTATAYKKTEAFSKLLFSKKFKTDAKLNVFSKSLERIKSVKELPRYYMDRMRDMWLQPDVLVIGDRMGMRHSIETRSPLVDADLTNLLITSKQTVAAWKNEHKYWMKEALADKVPKFVFNKKKQGFTPPVARWLLKILWRYIYLLNSDGFLVKYEILNKNKLTLARLLWMFLPIYWYQYYQLLVLEIWGRHYVMGESISKF